MKSIEPGRRSHTALGLAVLSLAGWIFLAWLSHHPPALFVPWLLGVLAFQWGITALALRHAPASSPLQPILWGVAFRVVGLLAVPILEDDYFRFLWDGRMFALTGNPYESTPSAHFADPTVPSTFGDILDRINYPDVPTVYGPVCQLAFLVAYWIAPGALLSWKLLLLGVDLLFLIALYFLARRERGPVAAQVLMFAAWCPLSVFETAFNAHPDALGVMIITAAALAWHTQRHRVLGVTCAAAVAAKIVALPLVPFFLWRKPRAAWLAFGLTLVACYAPFWIQGSTADLEGLRILSTEWEFNSSLYALLALVLEPSFARITAAMLFLVVWGLAFYANHTSGKNSTARVSHACNPSQTLSETLSETLSTPSSQPSSRPSSIRHWGATRILRGFRQRFRQSFRQRTDHATHSPTPHSPTIHFPTLLLLFFLLSPTFNPWYALWLLPFIALQPSRTGLVCMAAVSLSYLTHQNMGLANPDGFGHPFWVRLLEFGLIALTALSERLRIRSFDRRHPGDRSSGFSVTLSPTDRMWLSAHSMSRIPSNRKAWFLFLVVLNFAGATLGQSPAGTVDRVAQTTPPQAPQPSPSTAFDHAHTKLAQVLTRFASTSGVDYAALKTNPATLAAYLDELDRVSEAQFRAWPRPEQLAFLLNLYNASTLKLVVDHYPITSIRKIGGLFRSPWKLESVHIWGQDATLDWLEHGFIRPQFKDPRTHFALVCAAHGCPPLRLEPYQASKLDAQLDEQGRLFMAQSEKNRFDPATRTLHVSPIFKWYREDFVAPNRTLAQSLKAYFPPTQAAALDQPGIRVAYTDYDWSLNESVTKPK